MSVETSIVSALEADSAVTSLVGTNVYSVETDEQRVVPYVVYELISSFPVQGNSPAIELNESVIQIGCYGATYSLSKQIAAAVRSCLIQTLGCSVIEDTHDERDSDTRRLFIVQTYRIWHEETFP